MSVSRTDSKVKPVVPLILGALEFHVPHSNRHLGHPVNAGSV